jgi:hypothetical protein
MARSYLIFGDIEGKLDVLRVECTRCGRKGRYSVRKLIEKYGRKANMMKWKQQLNGDCPKRDAPGPPATQFGAQLQPNQPRRRRRLRTRLACAIKPP